uniref:Uncharacterized protein n=1 Tax=Moniliophthora roreri TaxID=221103 RepID=A0A0W0EY83_MONRR
MALATVDDNGWDQSQKGGKIFEQPNLPLGWSLNSLLSFLTTITIDDGLTFTSFIHPTQSFHEFYNPLMHNNVCPHCNRTYNGPSALTNHVQRCVAGHQSMQGLFNMAKHCKVVHNQPIAGPSTHPAVPPILGGSLELYL